MGDLEDGDVDAEGQTGDLKNPGGSKNKRVRVSREKTVATLKTESGTDVKIERTIYEREEFDGVEVKAMEPPRAKWPKGSKIYKLTLDALSWLV